MHNSVAALVIYGVWTLLLLIAITGIRAAMTLHGCRAANSFSPTGEDVSPLSARLCRAHANCYENLPVFATIVLAAEVSGRSNITDPAALVVVGARLAQSITHVISTSDLAVHFRFAFLAVQIVFLVYWALRLLSAWAA